MKKIPGILVVMFLLLPVTAVAKPIIADLAIRSIDIDTSFRGMNILLFGAREDPGDIMVVVRGPEKHYVVRKKERIAGVWINSKQKEFDNIYSFYTIASSKPVEKIDNEYLLTSLGIGIDSLNWKPDKINRFEASDEFSKAMLETKQKLRLYPKNVEKVSFWGETLFRTNIVFPDNIPEGKYTAEVYLINDGKLSSIQATPIYVKKVGFEAFMYHLAHNNEIVYGLLSVGMALLAGWLASMIFQRI